MQRAGMSVKCVLVKVLLAVVFVLAMLPQSAVAAPSPETFKQNEQGLEKQVEAFLKAYQRGDDKGMDEGFALFRLPKAAEWFGNYFSAEEAAKLASLYDREMSDAEASL